MAQQEVKTRPASVLEDPSAKAVARVYADAYLNAAASVGVTNPLEEFASFQNDVLDPNPEFEQLLTSQFTSKDDKDGIIDRVVQPRASELFTHFLKVLNSNDRLDLLPAILRECIAEQERRAGQKRVEVHSAVELTEAQQKAIRDQLKTVLNIEPILIAQTNPDLVGGLVIRVGDTIYDGSLKTRLKMLAHRLRERYLYEIQSGRDRFSSSEGN
jgi:F-type H+-transporting ATPase subunit delta